MTIPRLILLFAFCRTAAAQWSDESRAGPPAHVAAPRAHNAELVEFSITSRAGGPLKIGGDVRVFRDDKELSGEISSRSGDVFRVVPRN